MHKQKAPIYKLSCSIAPKNGKFRVADIRETQWSFLWYHTGVDFSSRNKFANVGFFAKVSVSVESIIFCTQLLLIRSCGPTICSSPNSSDINLVFVNLYIIIGAQLLIGSNYLQLLIAQVLLLLALLVNNLKANCMAILSFVSI